MNVVSMWAGDQIDAGLALNEPLPLPPPPPPPQKLWMEWMGWKMKI